MSSQAPTLEDLVSTFQSTSESLERSYRDLQGRVQSLIFKLERERAERLAALGEMAMILTPEERNSGIEISTSMFHGESAGRIVRIVRISNNPVSNVTASERIQIHRLLARLRVLLQPVAVQKGIRIAIDCDSTLCTTVDSVQLHRILLNLVLNALRETPMDGMVRLKGRVAGCDLILEVEEDRASMPHQLTRLFDPMFTRTAPDAV